MPVLAANWPVGSKPIPLMCQQQPMLNFKRRVYSAYTKGTPQVPAWVIGEAVPLGPTGHLLL